MFDFDDYESLNDYEFFYPIEEVLETQYHLYKRKKEKGFLPYEEWVYNTVYDCIMMGLNRYGEVEHEWYRLKFYLENLENFEVSKVGQKVHIIYDQALLLLFDTHPLPPNFII